MGSLFLIFEKIRSCLECITPIKVVRIDYGERFVDHGSVADLRKLIRLDSTGLAGQVRETLAELGVAPHESIPA